MTQWNQDIEIWNQKTFISFTDSTGNDTTQKAYRGIKAFTWNH